MDYAGFIERMYVDFNERNIDSALGHLTKDADWPNGMTGGREIGHDAIRSYWTHQWTVIDSKVTPICINSFDEGAFVEVRQLFYDLDGKLVSDSIVTHKFIFKSGKVSKMEINAPSPQADA